jgi:hypothetical protein
MKKFAYKSEGDKFRLREDIAPLGRDVNTLPVTSNT